MEKRDVHMGEKSGGSEGDVPLPALPYQGGSGPPQSSDPSPDKGLGGFPILCWEEARLLQAAMHPAGQERALQPQATAAEPKQVGPTEQAGRGREPGAETSLLLQHLSDGARALCTSLWTRDGP